MSRTFLYTRVSTADQTTDNQVLEVNKAGFEVLPSRIVSETVSGSVAASQRKGFAALLDKMEEGDVLVVTKLDRLGRDAMDVETTFNELEGRKIKVHCLALGEMDLTSASGKLYRKMLSAFAQFERDLLIERTNAGLARAKQEGKKLGRPAALSEKDKPVILDRIVKGDTISAIAADFKVSRASIIRVRESAQHVNV
jgi:putative DNA-invertase from lambdoid prophage Rac